MDAFIKWAGGKRWLINNHSQLFPSREDYKRYVEPFVGGGSIFFALEPEEALINDINEELIITYKQVKCNWKKIKTRLDELNHIHSPNLYYKIRAEKPTTASETAVRFLYLNRTCWNGLYRVNKNNVFNVPIGTKTKVVLDSDDFERASRILQNSEICSTDFGEVIRKCKQDDFLFVDPPYTVKHNLNGFIKYNEKLFTWNDQIRLRDSVAQAVDRGVKVLILNADHESIRNLYEGLGELISLSRASVISGKKESRGSYTELVVKCY